MRPSRNRQIAWKVRTSTSGTQRTGRPEDNLTANIKQLTWFGERASWSPDGQRIAFMSKSFGHAFEIDLSTRRIRLLRHYPNPGYLRASSTCPHSGWARELQDVRRTQYKDQELWILRADDAASPFRSTRL